MANRSYLYVINEKGTGIGDVSEYPHDLPLFYKILLSEDTELVESYLFQTKDPIAYKGSFAKGMNTYYAFLEYLYTLPDVNKDLIKGYINETKTFFKNKRPGEWDKFLLEPGEYFDLLSDQFPIADQGRIVQMEIKGLAYDIDELLRNQPMDFLSKASDKYWIQELQEDMSRIAPCWSEVCYYSFNASLKK